CDVLGFWLPAAAPAAIYTLCLHGALPISWDRMYRVLGTQQSDFSLSENTQNLQSVTYDSAEAMTWDESEDLSKSWQIQRTGRFKDRKSTRLNSSHVKISYAVFCLKKKNKK